MLTAKTSDVLDEAEFRAEQLQEQKMMLEEKISVMKESFEGNSNIVETLQEEKENMVFQMGQMEDDLKKKQVMILA